MTFEAKKSVNSILKSGCLNISALKISKQYSKMTTTVSGVYVGVTQYISVLIFFDKNI